MIKRIKKNPWPFAIVGYFVIFITAMGGWITFAVRNDMDLVREDYYEHEIRYQKHIDSVARTAAIRNEVNISCDQNHQLLIISMPKDHVRASDADAITGELHLYRPSDSKLDQRFPLALTQGAQSIPVAHLAPGLWKVRLSWNAAGSEYYFDQMIVLAAR